MPTFSFETLRSLACQTAAALGAPPEEAAMIGESLARANLAGHDSHGIIRLEQYTQMVKDRDLIPGAPTATVRETACTALLDGGWNFGQVVARRALKLGMEKARQYGTGTISVRNSHHLGRLGEYPLRAAEAGFLCFAAVNNHGRGTSVAPFGGTAGRLSTNPLAFAAPGTERPILVDITTSVVAEGKVRLKKNAREPVPEGWLQDSEGQPTTDPEALYSTPPGSLLPFGGPVAHKGYALGVMVDILSGALSGAGCSQSSTCRLGNAMYFHVVDVEKFLPREEYLEQVDRLIRHLKSSPPAPGFDEVLLPGEPEWRAEQRRLRAGIWVDAETWRQFSECAQKLGVNVPGDV